MLETGLCFCPLFSPEPSADRIEDGCLGVYSAERLYVPGLEKWKAMGATLSIYRDKS
jgi:hypothetical protein